jgi:hypothetical protein
MLRSETVTWQGSTRHFALVTAAAAGALVAALPAAASAKLIQPISVSASANVPAHQSRAVFLKCPARAVALNAAATSAMDATDSVPRFTARGWTLTFTAGNSSRTATGVLRCVRMDLPQGIDGVGLNVETQIEPVATLSPGASEKLSIGCSHGFVPTGWGLDRADEASGLAIAAALPTKHGWSLTVENTGTTAAGGTLYTRCLERKQRASTGQRHAFKTRVAKSSVSGSSATRSCRASEFSVATGLSLPIQDDIFLTGTGPVGEHSGQWRFAKASGAGAVKTSLVCLSTATAFH